MNAALLQFHRKIRQSEDDNVGVEAAHKSEETAELSVRAGRSAYRSHKLKPYRKSAKAEKRLDRANLGYLQKKAARESKRAAAILDGTAKAFSSSEAFLWRLLSF